MPQIFKTESCENISVNKPWVVSFDKLKICLCFVVLRLLKFCFICDVAENGYEVSLSLKLEWREFNSLLRFKAFNWSIGKRLSNLLKV